ncbi:unnamed protein product, partial [Allacma fusca]
EEGFVNEVSVSLDNLKSKGYPTLDIRVVSVNKFIVKVNPVNASSQLDLGEMFFDGKLNYAQVEGHSKRVSNSFLKNQLVIANIPDLGGDDDEEGTHYFRGVVLSWTPDKLCEVFLCDLGITRNLNPVEMTPVSDDNKKFLSSPSSYVFLTIPGIVPRKRMDNIPGLSRMNIQDTQWNEGARKDVEVWLTKYPIKLIYKIREDAFSSWYGDFFGAESQESDLVMNDSLSHHLIGCKNVFMNLQALHLI